MGLMRDLYTTSFIFKYMMSTKLRISQIKLHLKSDSKKKKKRQLNVIVYK